jgi:iron donor protein CyaY
MAGARHFTDLTCWQLADELRVAVLALTERPGFATDFKLRSQTEDAIGSVCRNIAEGFGCESHDENARFLEISRRSLNEVQDCLRHAVVKGHIASTDTAPLFALMRRLYPAINRLWAYLKRTSNPRARTKSRHPRTDPAMRSITNRAKRPSTDPAKRLARTRRSDPAPTRYDHFMTEQEFRIKADEALESAEASLLSLADEEGFELEKQNGVLQVEFEEPPAKFIVSPNAPVRQIWVSAMAKSYKLSWSETTGTFEIDGEPLNALLDRLARLHLAS